MNVDMPTPERLAPAPTLELPAPVSRGPLGVPRWLSTLLAFGSLALACGLAVGVLAGGGAILHLAYPRRRLDVFAALHHVWVESVLVAIALLWLLPPHPWARHAVVSPDPPTAGPSPPS